MREQNQKIEKAKAALVYYNQTISEIVRNDYRTADVFKKHGINYCCGGNISLQEVCYQRGMDYDTIVNDLNAVSRRIGISSALNFSEWKLEFLIDYIVNIHHAYQKIALPSIESSLISFVEGHKKKFPELEKVLELFLHLRRLIPPHNRHEEEIIFPYIKLIENTHRRKETYGHLFVRTLRKPLSHIENEHGEILTTLKEIQTLTNQYTFPDNACTNHRVVFNKLREFHDDMLQHNHLENDVLFPRAIELEKELLQL